MTDRRCISLLLAAKTANNHPDHWLSLFTHHEDTAAVIALLVNRLPDTVIAALDTDRQALKRLLIFLAFVHDIGKATVLFQNRITSLLPEVRARRRSLC